MTNVTKIQRSSSGKVEGPERKSRIGSLLPVSTLAQHFYRKSQYKSLLSCVKLHPINKRPVQRGWFIPRRESAIS